MIPSNMRGIIISLSVFASILLLVMFTNNASDEKYSMRGAMKDEQISYNPFGVHRLMPTSTSLDEEVNCNDELTPCLLETECSYCLNQFTGAIEEAASYRDCDIFLAEFQNGFPLGCDSVTPDTLLYDVAVCLIDTVSPYAPCGSKEPTLTDIVTFSPTQSPTMAPTIK